MLESYDTYTYMKKRWEKYVRKQGIENVSWETVLHRIVLFLRPVWNAMPGRDFFRRLDAGSGTIFIRGCPQAAFISGFIVCPDIPGGM